MLMLMVDEVVNNRQWICALYTIMVLLIRSSISPTRIVIVETERKIDEYELAIKQQYLYR
jgi:hypothetical protein